VSPKANGVRHAKLWNSPPTLAFDAPQPLATLALTP